MNNDYSQQFMQNLKTQPVQSPSNDSGNSKTPLAIIIILAIALFIESIILVVMAINNSTLANKINAEEAYEESIEAEVADDVDPDYVFDEDNNLSAINLECQSENGSSIALLTNNSYKLYDATTQASTSGTYTINRDSIIQLNGSSNKTFFYDGAIITDGSAIYECGGILNEVEDDTE